MASYEAHKAWREKNLKHLAQRQKEWRKNNSERSKQLMRESGQRNKNNKTQCRTSEVRLLYSAKRNARTYNREFDLSIDDISIPTHCPITGKEIITGVVLDRHDESWKYRNQRPSIDRVDNSKGYVKGNVRIISQEGNRIKAGLDIDMCERIISYIRGDI